VIIVGKYERKDIFIAENILNELLNGFDVPENTKGHKYVPHMKVLAKRIKRDFPNIRRSHHVGNIYGTSLGNMKLELLDGEVVFLEIKILSQGSGTRANISQDTLTNFSLFEGKNIFSWKAFREKNSHNERLNKELNKFINYPSDVGTIYQKASYLKGLLKTRGGESTESAAKRVLSVPTSSRENALAARIVIEIMREARAEKVEYIEYLKTLKQNHENIKKFLFLILAGGHTKQYLKENWNKSLSEILEVLGQEYLVYYIYKNTLRVKLENLTKKLRNLIDKDIFISSRKGQTNVLISFIDKRGDEVPILRIVFHWKNIFQGIKTPCLNIFDERYLSL